MTLSIDDRVSLNTMIAEAFPPLDRPGAWPTFDENRIHRTMLRATLASMTIAADTGPTAQPTCGTCGHRPIFHERFKGPCGFRVPRCECSGFLLPVGVTE